MLQLIFRPEGVQPTRADFRIIGTSQDLPPFSLTFFSWDEVIEHLVKNDPPEGGKPWVMEGTTLSDPEDVSHRMPG
jgi:hypothetical protein